MLASPQQVPQVMLQIPDLHKVSGAHQEVLGTAAALATPRVRPASGCDIFRSIDELIVLKVLGRGTFASVRQAIHRPSGRIFALKTVRRDKVIQEGGHAEHLVREANVQVRMRHRNIVLLYGHFEDSERVHFVLEFVAGGQLLQRMRKIGRLSREEAARMFLDVISALMYIHQHNIVHRDIKPENVLLQEQDKSDEYIAKIGDFGCCAMLSDLEPTRNTLCGTMDYLAPEMIDQQPHDHRVDVWASGVLLYEMLVGEPPFKAKSQLEALRRILSSEVQCPSFMDEDAADLIRLLLHKSCKARLPLAQAASHAYVTKFAGKDHPNGRTELREEKHDVGPSTSKPASNTPVPALGLGLICKPIAENECHCRQSISPVARRPAMPQTARLARPSRSPPPCRKERLSTPATLQARHWGSPLKQTEKDRSRQISEKTLLPLESVACENSPLGDRDFRDDESGCSYLSDDTPSCSLVSANTPVHNSFACEQTPSNPVKGDVTNSTGTYSCSSRAIAGGPSFKAPGSRLRSLTPPQGELEETAAKISGGCRTPDGRSPRAEARASPPKSDASPRESRALPFSSSPPVLMQSALLAQEAAYQLEADTSQLAVCSRTAPRAKVASTRNGPPSEPRTSTTPTAFSSISVATSGSSYANPVEAMNESI